MAIAAAAAAAAAVSQTDDQSAGISSSHSNNSNTGSSSPNIITLNNPPPHGTVNTAAATHPNPFVAALLNQLAMNDVPETLANPNPERPLLRLASKDIQIRAGHECPRGTRF
jgi:hypothetical protein